MSNEPYEDLSLEDYFQQFRSEHQEHMPKPNWPTSGNQPANAVDGASAWGSRARRDGNSVDLAGSIKSRRVDAACRNKTKCYLLPRSSQQTVTECSDP